MKNIAAEQMRQINVEPIKILLEPFGKNTAPAILAALIASEIKNDPILLILSADHKLRKKKVLKKQLKKV